MASNTRQQQSRDTSSQREGASTSGRRHNRMNSFINSVESRLSEYPVIGAVVLDAIVIGCERLGEALEKFQAHAKEKAEELRASSNGSQKRSSGFARSSSEPRTSQAQ